MPAGGARLASSLPEVTHYGASIGAIGNPDLALSEDLGEEEIEAYWGSVAHFVERGIGFCVLHGAEEVSHCTADCATDTQVDVASIPLPLTGARPGRRSGRRDRRACLNHGARQVGGTATWRTPPRGKRRSGWVSTGTANTCITIRVRHGGAVLELGWHHLQDGNYASRPITMSKRSRRATITRRSIITVQPWPGRTWGRRPGARYAERGR